MATYKQIQAYVKNHLGWTPKTCWIADVLAYYGLTRRKAWNRKGKERVNPCPPKIRAAIEEALKHFGMIK